MKRVCFHYKKCFLKKSHLSNFCTNSFHFILVILIQWRWVNFSFNKILINLSSLLKSFEAKNWTDSLQQFSPENICNIFSFNPPDRVNVPTPFPWFCVPLIWQIPMPRNGAKSDWKLNHYESIFVFNFCRHRIVLTKKK